MATPIYEPLARAALFIETLDHQEPLHSLLTSAGYTQALHKEGHDALHSAQEALDHISAELQRDKIAGHLVHTASTELEMWHQTARAHARRAIGEDDPRFAGLMGEHLHAPNHTATAMAQALRFMAVLRLDEDLRESFGSERRVEDLLQRGRALYQKLRRLADNHANPDGADAEPHLAPVTDKLAGWLSRATPIAAKGLSDRPGSLGQLGVVPLDGTALPLGGTASRVTRHAQTSRHAPTGGPSPPAPGWSVGRQNRNAENRGKGY